MVPMLCNNRSTYNVLDTRRYPSARLSMNLGFAEQHPKRQWFVVERFSAVVAPFRNALRSALKRSTTNLTSEGSWARFATMWSLNLSLNPESLRGGSERGDACATVPNSPISSPPLRG